MQEMKYFNEGNDCDICKNQLMTGRDGTVEDCRRRQNGLSCRFEERDIRTCPVCEHEVDREDMYFTKDCHQIIGILLRNGEKVPKSIENQLYKRLDALDAQIFECEMEYKEIVTALTGENRRKEHGNRIQRHGRTEQE